MKARGISNAVLRRPLIILAGDVGAGKSELAVLEDMVARQEKIDVELLPLSLSY